jgi:hypothetical protein
MQTIALICVVRSYLSGFSDIGGAAKWMQAASRFAREVGQIAWVYKTQVSGARGPQNC